MTATQGSDPPNPHLDTELDRTDVPVGDGIDRIVEQWNRERPELDLRPTEVIGRIDRASVHLRRGVDATLRSYGLHRGGFAVLAALRRSGPPYRLRPTELFTGLLSSSGAMTNRVDRLEEDGLIMRVRDPNDRRGVIVELTATGRSLADEVADAHLANERELLSPLTTAEQDQLAALLRTLLISFENETANA